MRGRTLTKKIEVWQIDSVADGFGGNTVSETFVSNQWATINTIQVGKGKNISSQFAQSEFGLIDVSRTIFITVRKGVIDYDVDTMFIKYRNKKYTINFAPINVNFDDRMLVFAATEEQTKSNTTSP